MGWLLLAGELLHLPDEPAGVGVGRRCILAGELLHLPDKPAGVLSPARLASRDKTGTGLRTIGSCPRYLKRSQKRPPSAWLFALQVQRDGSVRRDPLFQHGLARIAVLLWDDILGRPFLGR